MPSVGPGLSAGDTQTTGVGTCMALTVQWSKEEPFGSTHLQGMGRLSSQLLAV